MSQESRWNRRDTLAALALVAASFALRALFLFGAEDAAWPHSTLYEGDAIVWLDWARALRAGQPFEFDLPVRAPGLAFLLSWLGGELVAPFTGLKLLFCGLSAATVGLFFAGSNLADAHYRKDANGYSFSGVDVVSLGAGRRLSAGLEFQFR